MIILKSLTMAALVIWALMFIKAPWE